MSVRASRITLATFVGAGLLLAIALAFFVSPQASSQPDGLNRVAIDQGFAQDETDHRLADTPTAGYSVAAVDNDRLSTGLAGLVGVAITFAATVGLTAVVRWNRGRRRPALSGSSGPA